VAEFLAWIADSKGGTGRIDRTEILIGLRLQTRLQPPRQANISDTPEGRMGLDRRAVEPRVGAGFIIPPTPYFCCEQIRERQVCKEEDLNQQAACCNRGS